MFGSGPGVFGEEKTYQMRFKADGGLVDVKFIDTNLQLYLDDDPIKSVTFNMQMGWIDPTYQTSMYFDNYKENMLGLAPMLSEANDPEIMQRQFLY